MKISLVISVVVFSVLFSPFLVHAQEAVMSDSITASMDVIADPDVSIIKELPVVKSEGGGYNEIVPQAPQNQNPMDGGGFSYSVTINTPYIFGTNISISGIGSANPYVGSFSHINSNHDVMVDWGDGVVDYTSTHNFIDPDGQGGLKTFSGPWSNAHTYEHSGSYDITVRLYHGESGGQESSEPVTIHVSVENDPFCSRADINQDHHVNPLDFPAFTQAFLASNMLTDFDGNGFLNANDFMTYMNVYAACHSW